MMKKSRRNNNPSTKTSQPPPPSKQPSRRLCRPRSSLGRKRVVVRPSLAMLLIIIIITAAVAAAFSSAASTNVGLFLHHPLPDDGVWRQQARRRRTPSSSSPRYAVSALFAAGAKSNNKKRASGGGSSSGGGAGFGAGGASSSSSSNSRKKKKASSSRNRLQDTLDDKPRAAKRQQQQSSPSGSNRPYVKDEQTALLEQLARQSASTPIGRAVAEFAAENNDINAVDPFWELMPSLIASRFPHVADDADLERLAGFVRHALATAANGGVSPRPVDWDDDDNGHHRPYEELHAYMPGLGPTRPFHDPNQLELCRLLEQNYETICREYQALLDHSDELSHGNVAKFQSVTSMNYDSGWRTLVLFYNGHRIQNFPYHLCPTTTRILESVPLAGRIAGFNRQQPNSGIPEHTDGNNLWLTAQMGIAVPDGNAAHIRVGPETRHWQNGQCLLYDTTYRHETHNAHPTRERVVLHVDFFNTLALTAVEIEILQYIYALREEFMKAEGVAKVGAQVL